MKQNEILAIRKLLYTERMSITDLANELGYSRAYVSMALNGRLINEGVDLKLRKWLKSKKEGK